jgi:hypothetical protein
MGEIMGEWSAFPSVRAVAWSDRRCSKAAIEERFLSPQAGHFAGAKREEKADLLCSE